jgi:hypothetical protein
VTGANVSNLHGTGVQFSDQVVRLRDWEEAHPDVDIDPPDYANGGWLWAARRDGVVLCCEYDLRKLLDHVDWLTAQEQPSHA